MKLSRHRRNYNPESKIQEKMYQEVCNIYNNILKEVRISENEEIKQLKKNIDLERLLYLLMYILIIIGRIIVYN